MLNNSDQKTCFFLPKKLPFLEDMVAILPLSFSFRVDHYDLLIKARILGLLPEFQAKIGYTISQLYGRVGAPDLSDNWGDDKVRKHIKKFLDQSNLVQVPDKSYIDYINKNHRLYTEVSIADLIEECKAEKLDELLQPNKHEIIKNIKIHLIKLFEDKDRLDKFSQMEKKELAKAVNVILNTAVH